MPPSTSIGMICRAIEIVGGMPALREHLGCSTLELMAWIDGVKRVPESILYGLADLILDEEIMTASTSAYSAAAILVPLEPDQGANKS